MRIGFIGTGVIASAIIEGIVADGHQIYVTERSRANSSRLAEKFDNVTIADAHLIASQCEVIIVCLMADTAREICPSLQFQAHQRVFSVMVGIPHEEWCELVEPAAEAGIFIPFPFIAQGGSPLLVYPQSDTLAEIFGGRNHLVTLPNEEALNSYLAAQAILLPTAKLLHEASQWLVSRTGDEVSAERFIRILVGGYLTAEDYDQTAVFPAMLQDLSTEGGLNAQLRDHFGTNGVYKILGSGLNQLEDRLSKS